MCFADSGSVYSFGSDYYGCLGCDNQEGDEVCTPVLIDFFTSKPVDQVYIAQNTPVLIDFFTSKPGEQEYIVYKVTVMSHNNIVREFFLYLLPCMHILYRVQ